MFTLVNVLLPFFLAADSFEIGVASAQEAAVTFLHPNTAHTSKEERDVQVRNLLEGWCRA